ncbi:MAG: hypothetical protein ACRC6V_12525 [Bacteroidales bacterium]
MSFFSNDIRVANTATPSFQSQANVSQYGWTGADQGHYNQLIQYVDECRKIWINLEEKITYVETLLESVADIDEQVMYINKVVEYITELRTEMVALRDEVLSHRNELKPLYDDFIIKYTDFSGKFPEVVRMYDETILNAAKAAVSETGAEEWYNRSKDLYDDLKEGQVYRGTWNPKTQAYPPHQGTNSVWDVVLDIGVTEVAYDGKLWRSGDRLLYVVSASEYQQLQTGGGVESVNGKVGAVTLVASDVGAVASTGGFYTGRFEFRKPQGTDGWPNATNSDSNNFINRAGLSHVAGNNGVHIFGDNAENRRRMGIQSGHATASYTTSPGVLELNPFGGEVRVNGSRVFTTGYVPTPSQIGAVPAGADGKLLQPLVTGAAATTGEDPSLHGFHVFRDRFGMNMLNHKDSVGSSGDLWGTNIFTDNVTQRYVTFSNKAGSAGTAADYKVTARINTATGEMYLKDGKQQVYHQGFKPTAIEIGALPVVGGKLTGTLNGTNANFTQNVYTNHNSTTTGSIGLSGNSIGYGEIVGKAKADTDYDWTTGIRYYGPGDWRIGSSGRIYHQNFKPTASDVGALAVSGGTVDGSVLVKGNVRVAPTGAPGVTLSGNSAGYGEVVRVSADGTHEWNDSIRGYGGNDWRIGSSSRIYHQNFKPTAVDVGALALSGGTLTGTLKFNTSVNQAITMNTTNSAGAYILGQKDGTSDWYVGRGNAAGDVALSSYTHGRSMVIQNDRIAVNAGIYINGNEVFHAGWDAIWRARSLGSSINNTDAILPGYFSIVPSTVGNPTGAIYGHGFALGPGQRAGSGVWGSQVIFGHDNKIYYRNSVNAINTGTWAQFYTTVNRPTAYDIQVNNPKTKMDETLFDVIAQLTARIEELEAKLK